MDLQEFVKNALRTESQIDTIKVDMQLLACCMSISIASGNMLDQIKKHVFYGKDYNQEEFVRNVKDIIISLDAFKDTSVINPNINYEDVELGVDPRLFHSIIGIATESAELLEALDLSGENVDNVNIGEEMADIDWYKAIFYDSSNIGWEDTLSAVINKLRTRYPEKFTSENAINRDLETERENLNEMENPKT